MLQSRTLAAIDLRLTRPPDNLRPNTQGDKRPSTQEGDTRSSGNDGGNITEKLSSPLKKKKQKGAKKKQETEVLFEDLSPEAQRRLNAMLRNFCEAENGAMKTDIDLEQYGIDAGEVITNATIQELCVIQPNIHFLNLSNCALITDVALWTIARHCPGIKHLILSGCDKITNIGLRSLSIRCSELLTLDFTNCHLLDDIGLSTVACGCWKLEKLLLVNCTGVTDTGVGKVVKSCGRLKMLDLNGCCRVGEFGDHALKEIGAFCPSLVYLDLMGCRHVHNDGLTAVAQGCQALETLRLSGCDGVSAQGILALCKYTKHLHTLTLSGCHTLRDADVHVLKHAVCNGSLTAVDLSDCKLITNAGVVSICSSLGHSLRSLNIAGCKVTDSVCPSICALCEKLNVLDLSQCRALTDNALHTIAKGISGLTTLKLDGNQKITTRAVMHYGAGESRLPFADVSQDWFGYCPKANAAKLILESERNRADTGSAVVIQCLIRRRIAWNVYKEKRRWWVIQHTIPRAQACYRGYLVRMKYRDYKQRVYEHRMATRVQNNYRRFANVMARYRIQRDIRINKLKLQSAMTIQRLYWGLVGRKRAQMRRNEVANERLEEARIQALREQKAIVIQCAWHIHIARGIMREKKKSLRLLRIRQSLEDRMARLLQRIERGRQGRKKARFVLWLKQQAALRFQMAKVIQRVYRGHVGRLIAAEERRLRLIRIRNEKALILQCFWRTLRARMIVAILRALRILRAKQFKNAREIQRVFRGYRARVALLAKRSEMEV